MTEKEIVLTVQKRRFLNELWIDGASLNRTIKLIKVVVENVLSHIKSDN